MELSKSSTQETDKLNWLLLCNELLQKIEFETEMLLKMRVIHP
jgi:hypothetical protein